MHEVAHHDLPKHYATRPFGDDALAGADLDLLAQPWAIRHGERGVKLFESILETSDKLARGIELGRCLAPSNRHAGGREYGGAAVDNIRDVRGELRKRFGALVRLPGPLSVGVTVQNLAGYGPLRREIFVKQLSGTKGN